VVEREAQLEQQPPLEDARGDLRVADRAEQDRLVPADRLEVRVRERLAGRVPAAGAEVEVGGAHRHVAARERRVEGQQALLDDLGADAVACDHCQLDGARHAATLAGRPTCRDAYLML
jgi:hypothetical protein